jgi:hypothetical protein
VIATMGLQRVFKKLTGARGPSSEATGAPAGDAAPTPVPAPTPEGSPAPVASPSVPVAVLPVDLARQAHRDDVRQVIELVDRGNLVEAVDLLAEANRHHREPDLEVALVALRHRAASATPRPAGREPWPPTYDDPFPDVVGGIPEVRASELTTEILGGAVAHHGCLIVRGVFSPEQIERTVAAIERTHEHHEADVEGGGPAPAGPDDDAWYRPFPTDGHNEILRRMVAVQGGTWLADSPTSTAQVLDELEAAGVTGAITGHLGERPYFSLHKSTLRRSQPAYNLVAWHQDGSFYDPDVRTMNVWVALSPCGGRYPSPGLEVIPRRFEEILPVDGVMTKHSISYELIAELAAECPTVIPEFEPGDAMLFDEHFVHRTHLTEGMTDIRYALECWFFAPSHVVSNYVPLLA